MDGGEHRRQHGEPRDASDVRVHLVDHPRHKERRKQRGDDADRERQGEPLHLGGRRVVQDQADDEVGDVGVEDRAERFLIAEPNRAAQFHFAAEDLLPDPLVDEHVGVDGHADGEHDAGQSGQREGAVDKRHEAEDDQAVDDERDAGDHAGEKVVQHHERRHRNDRDDKCIGAGLEIVGADRRSHGVDGDRIPAERRLERTGRKHMDEIVQLRL